MQNLKQKTFGLFITILFSFGLFAGFTADAYAENVTQSGGRYTATTWDENTNKAYYRVDGDAIVSDFNGRVARTQNAIQHGELDNLGRATWSAGYITPTLWAKEVAEDRESDTLPDPVGFVGNKQVTIELYDGKKPYSGYFYNRSHLVADSLGGDPIKENLVTGTRTQNVGANDGKGGMAYTETKAREYMKANPQATLYYSAIPVYVGNELVPRSVYVDIKSDDGTINEHVEVYNTAKGYYINYTDGTWGQGNPNSTRTGSPNVNPEPTPDAVDLNGLKCLINGQELSTFNPTVDYYNLGSFTTAPNIKIENVPEGYTFINTAIASNLREEVNGSQVESVLWELELFPNNQLEFNPDGIITLLPTTGPSSSIAKYTFYYEVGAISNADTTPANNTTDNNQSTATNVVKTSALSNTNQNRTTANAIPSATDAQTQASNTTFSATGKTLAATSDNINVFASLLFFSILLLTTSTLIRVSQKQNLVKK